MELEKFTENGFTVYIEQDPDAESPRNDDTPGCGLVMYHTRYNFPNDAGIDLGDFNGWNAVAAELKANHGALVVETVWAYDHGSIAFKTGERTYPFDDSWDSGTVGVAYVTAQNWQETQGTKWTGSEEQLAQASKLIASDVEVYGQYVNGETYGYRIVDEYGDEVAACWGFIGSDAVTQAAKESANSLEHVVKCNGQLNRTSGRIEHEGDCPLHDAADSTEGNPRALGEYDNGPMTGA